MGNERADERDPKVSRRYRDLGSEEPPKALDDAILAAGRRASARRPRRWYAPLAAAAILVLAVGVAVHVDWQRPDHESVEPVAQPPVLKDDSAMPTPPPEVATQPKPSARQAPAEVPKERGETPASSPSEHKAMARLAEAPERWLERIAQMRKDGRNEEADKELAEFRKRYPDYAIPDGK